MLSEHEREALRDIERRLRWESPQLVRLFTSTDPPVHDRGKRARTRALIAAALVAGLTLRGPRMLSEAEVSAHNSRPLARRSPSDNASARAADASDPADEFRHRVAVIELVVGESTTVSTSSGHCRHTACQRTDAAAIEPANQTIGVSSRPIALARNATTNDRRHVGTGLQQ